MMLSQEIMLCCEFQGLSTECVLCCDKAPVSFTFIYIYSRGTSVTVWKWLDYPNDFFDTQEISWLSSGAWSYPGTHFTKNFPIVIQIWWKIGFSVTPL